MLCERCKKRTASVHIIKIVNNEQETKYLCEKCASEQGELNIFNPSPFSVQSLLAGLLKMEPPMAGPAHGGTQVKMQCENCGLTFSQFGQIGRFGCSNCYDTFRERLGPLLRRIHGSAQHAGKIPARSGSVLRVQRDINVLREKLQDAVNREEFEEAARLRDLIRDLEAKIDGEGRDAL